MPTIAAAFGLAPDVCAHDAITCLQKKIADARQEGVVQTWRSLNEHVGADSLVPRTGSCSHTLGCYVTYHSKGPHLAGPCQACHAAINAKVAVFSEILEMFVYLPLGTSQIEILDKIVKMKQAHKATTWEDDL